MIFNKRTCTVSLLLFCYIVCFSQNADDSLLTAKLSYNYIDYCKYMTKKHLVFYGGNYSIIKPHSQNFTFNKTYGYALRGGIVIFPFIIDAEIIILNKLSLKQKIEMPLFVLRDGFNGSSSSSLSICPLPRFSTWSEKFFPYVGIGYQWSALYLSDKISVDDYYSQLNLSSWFCKIGCNISANEWFNVVLEVEQSINKEKDRNFTGIKAGFSFNAYNFFKSFGGRSNNKFINNYILTK